MSEDLHRGDVVEVIGEGSLLSEAKRGDGV